MADATVECVVIHRNQKHEWCLQLENGEIEDNAESFQEFCDFLEDHLRIPNIDIDEWSDNLELFHIDNEHDLVNDESSARKITDSAGFGQVFDNVGDGKAFYFLVKMSKTLKVNLTQVDDSKTAELITKMSVPDEEDEETWGILWQDLTQRIANATGHLKWDSIYSLHFGNQRIDKIVDLQTVFESNLDENVLQFSVKVSSITFFLFSSFYVCLG